MNPRFFVPDLSPLDRPGLSGVHLRLIFVAESPHVSEIEPDSPSERRPLCGKAGKLWWRKLGEVFDSNPTDDVSLEHMLGFCSRHRFAVMNAVQYPLDPKIALHFPPAEPIANLGFAKTSGEFSYKKRNTNPKVEPVLEGLRQRLTHGAMTGVPVVVLGNDAEWFVTAALGPEQARARILSKIPHPSAWWRKSGFFGRLATQKLQEILPRNSLKFDSQSPT